MAERAAEVGLVPIAVAAHHHCMSKVTLTTELPVGGRRLHLACPRVTNSPGWVRYSVQQHDNEYAAVT